MLSRNVIPTVTFVFVLNHKKLVCSGTKQTILSQSLKFLGKINKSKIFSVGAEGFFRQLKFEVRKYQILWFQIYTVCSTLWPLSDLNKINFNEE